MSIKEIKDISLKKLIALQRKYNRKKDFDFILYLEKLIGRLTILDNFSQKIKTDKKSFSILKRLLKLKCKENKLLKEISPSIEFEISMFFLNGNKKNVNALKAVKNIPSINDSFISIHQGFTNIFINTCSRFIKNYAVKDIPGKTYRYSKPKMLIENLIPVFHLMTGKVPQCETDRELEKGDPQYDKYKGRFYKFLLELRPILEKSFNLRLGTDKVIGKYANSLIKKYKENII